MLDAVCTKWTVYWKKSQAVFWGRVIKYKVMRQKFYLNWSYGNNHRTSLVAQMVKNPPAVQETRVWSLGWEDALEKRMILTPVFLPGEFHGHMTWWATIHGVTKSQIELSDWTLSPSPYRDNRTWNQFSSVAQSCPTLRLHESQHARPPCPSPTPGVHSDSRPSSRWCHPAISSSVLPFSSCPQSLPASESFPMSQLFT